MANQTPVSLLTKLMLTTIIFKRFYTILAIQNSEEPIFQILKALFHQLQKPHTVKHLNLHKKLI
jgi:hypothetical protein